MPRVFMLMREVQGCFKLREVAKKRYTRRFPNGGTQSHPRMEITHN